MEDNIQKEEMYNKIKAEYADIAEKILKIIEENQAKEKESE